MIVVWFQAIIIFFQANENFLSRWDENSNIVPGIETAFILIKMDCYEMITSLKGQKDRNSKISRLLECKIIAIDSIWEARP